MQNSLQVFLEQINDVFKLQLILVHKPGIFGFELTAIHLSFLFNIKTITKITQNLNAINNIQ